MRTIYWWFFLPLYQSTLTDVCFVKSGKTISIDLPPSHTIGNMAKIICKWKSCLKKKHIGADPMYSFEEKSCSEINIFLASVLSCVYTYTYKSFKTVITIYMYMDNFYQIIWIFLIKWCNRSQPWVFGWEQKALIYFSVFGSTTIITSAAPKTKKGFRILLKSGPNHHKKTPQW